MKTALIGLDGACFTVLDHLMSEGFMPRLSALCERSARRILKSTPLPITPQAWTTLATGRSMGHHGISDFVRVEFKSNTPVLRFNSSSDIHCEPLWLRASRFEKTVTLLNYIGTAPPPRIDGHVLPGFVPARHLRRSTHPQDLFEKLEGLGYINVRALGLDLDIEKRALQEMPAEQWARWIDLHSDRERAWFESLQYLLKVEPSDLTMIVFDGADKIQHLAYRYLDPRLIPENPSPWEIDIIERCRNYFRRLDDYIGEIVEMIGDDGRVFIASDHGFTRTHQVVYINKWLHDQGLLHWRDEAPKDELASIVVHRLTRHLDQFDWENTKAFALTPSSNGIFINNVPENEYHGFREELIEKLHTIKGPHGEAIVTEIKKREDWFAGPYMDRAPDLTLTLNDFGFVSVLNAHDVVVPRKEPAGTHHPDGIFLALGAGIEPGTEGRALEMVDIAPVLLHSLDLSIPSCYEGELPMDLYDSDYLMRNSPRIVEESTSIGSRDHSGEQMSEDDQEILIERLKTLGYIE
ncbi:MAG: alkaline phosphatase family protein [Methylococcales bacterium]